MRRLIPTRYAVVAAIAVSFVVAQGECQETRWLPTRQTHAWARFRIGSWKEVRIRTSTFDENEKVVRSGTTVARSRIINIRRGSVSLMISRTVEAAGQEFSAEPQEITQDLAPHLESSKIVGSGNVTIGDQNYPTQVVELVTKSGTKQDTSEVHHCAATVPQTLRRVTTSEDTQTPDVVTSTTVNVTCLNKMMDILGEMHCTWSVTTVVKRGSRMVTIREVHCKDVPGELVSQVTEERNADGKLVSRKELDLVGYGEGRLRRLFRRNR